MMRPWDTSEESRTVTNTRISVVVLTHNRLPEVSRTIERLLALPDRAQVIVADNGSADGTAAELARRFGGVRVVECGGNLGAAGRNRAAVLATTDYIAFSDDDTHWEAGSLSEAVRVLDSAQNVAVLSGKVLVGAARELDTTCARMNASPLAHGGLPGPALIGFMAGASVFRADVFHAHGGYEPRLFIGGEEALLSLDVLEAGHAIVYCDTIVVAHSPSPARDALLRRWMLARNAALVAWMRLPIAEALRETRRAFAQLSDDGLLGTHGFEFAHDLGWAIQRRRPVCGRVLEMRREVREAEQATDAAVPVPAAAQMLAARR